MREMRELVKTLVWGLINHQPRLLQPMKTTFKTVGEKKKTLKQMKMNGIIACKSILQEILKEFHQAGGYQTEAWIWERK